jgi:hypothetical protein
LKAKHFRLPNEDAAVRPGMDSGGWPLHPSASS